MLERQNMKLLNKSIKDKIAELNIPRLLSSSITDLIDYKTAVISGKTE